jgi:ABC-type glycerol-3-phosphate transport system substrate-binding protein
MRNGSLGKVLCILLMVVLVMSVGVTSAATKTITLRFAVFGQQDIDYFQNKVDLAKAYQKVKPNVKIELEIIKDSG